MNYQIGNNNQQTGYDNSLFGGVAMSGAGQTGSGGRSNDILNGSNVGDLLACKLVKGGKEPVLDINGIQMKTKAAKELENAQPGDTIYLKIQEANKNQVSLKIVGTQPAAGQGMLDAATGAQVMQSTEQFSEMIKENLDGALDEKEAKENQKEILRTLTAEEIGKLRMMQIDISNAVLSDLMGMVITIRSGEHQDEINEQIGDIVKETLGKLRDSVAPGGASQQPEPPQAAAGEAVEAEADESGYRGPVRLNSEGYVVDAATAMKDVADSKAGQPQSGAAANPAENITRPEDDYIRSDTALISDEQLIYMVKNNMGLTIENLGTAQHSVNEESPAVELPVNEKVWNDIYPQVTGIVESAGMSVNDRSLGAARFMLQHELPITVDSLRLYMAVYSVNQRGIQVSQIEENIEEQIAMGNPPEQARISGSSIKDRASRLIERIQGITAKAVDNAVLQGKPVTVSYLYNVSMRSVDMRRMRGPVNTGVEGASLSLSGVGQDGSQPESVMPLSNNPSAVTARRQLEEIRLSMTIEAAVRLVRQDINIDARPLSRIVEALRQEENQYYDKVVSTQDLHDVPEDVDLLKETLKETDGLKNLPEYTLGEMVKRPTVTVGGLYEAGNRIKAVLAGQAYETMMTRPRRDMGDSITEAFQNVDAILADMDMDRNEENQRAVRILAYNEMELNRTNIASVKAADAKVQQMFETLTPQIVLNLIRESKNPLNMTIDGLNEEIMQQREVRGITDEQRFSEFLYQMDRNNEITDAERQSFIGIYRLLDKIEKSRGKDIGAIVRNGQEVTLNNLFSADKSRKARGIDVSVDENFGERVDVETQEGGILHQIETAYNQTITGSILRHIRPETLKGMERTDYLNMSFEELNAIMKAGDNGQGEGELTEELSEELKQALSYEEEVETMLDANNMPKTVTNIIAAHQVMYGEDGIYGMIRRIKNGLPQDKREKITAKEAQILENLESKSDVVYGLENIRSNLSEAIHDKEQDGTITSMDIQALKYLNAGMPIAMRAVEEDVFRIPLVMGDEVSIMKVSIMQDGSHAGDITATVQTAKYGVLEAFIHMEGNQLEGYVETEEEAGQKALENNELTIRSAFAKVGMEVRDLRLDGTRPMQYGAEGGGQEVSVSRLYKAAKQLLIAIKLTGITADN
ncbi:MAG: DUF6240 domain-containing protein [Clostridium sp.]|nr:DUF6240 domain-containing protein [Clostridium sp.]